MIGAVHACIGAGVGSLIDNRGGAFAAGVVSHIIADALPHRDLTPEIEAPLLAGAMAAIACWKGLDSPEFWGALGAVAPDFEHALAYVGLIDNDTKFFPTHIDDGKWHGDQNGTERWSQLILGAVSIALASLNTSE